jgi:hypothetical protein
MLRLYQEDHSVAFSQQLRLTSHQRPYEHSMATVWALEDLSSPATDLLHVISLLDPDCIQEEILTSKISAKQLDNWPFNYNKYTEARTELSKSSLVRRNKDLNQLRVHRLVQDVTRNQMTEERLKVVFEFIVELLITVWPSDPVKFSHTTSAWKTGEMVIRHIMKLDEFYSGHKEMVESTNNKDMFAELLKQAGW